MKESFAKCLFRLRTAGGFTQESLSSKAGVSVAALRHWEQGRREPYIGTAAVLAKALGVSLAEFDGCAFKADEPAKKRGK